MLHALKLGEGRWAQSLATLMRDLRLSIIFAVLTIGIFATMVLQVWIISADVAVRLSPGEASVALGASVAAGIASFLPLGLGVLDWTMTAMMQHAGASVASATSVAILYRATNSLPAGLLGLLGYAYLVAKLGRTPERAVDRRALQRAQATRRRPRRKESNDGRHSTFRTSSWMADGRPLSSSQDGCLALVACSGEDKVNEPQQTVAPTAASDVDGDDIRAAVELPRAARHNRRLRAY